MIQDSTKQREHFCSTVMTPNALKLVTCHSGLPCHYLGTLAFFRLIVKYSPPPPRHLAHLCCLTHLSGLSQSSQRRSLCLVESRVNFEKQQRLLPSCSCHQEAPVGLLSLQTGRQPPPAAVSFQAASKLASLSLKPWLRRFSKLLCLCPIQAILSCHSK